MIQTTTKKRVKKKPVPLHAPSSETHKVFLNCKSDFIIFGGGAGFDLVPSSGDI